MSDYRSVLRSIKKDLLANRLLEARQRSGKTQYQVAQAIGIGESTVSTIENGGLVPNLLVSADLAKAYGVTLDWLIGGEDDKREGLQNHERGRANEKNA